MHGVQMYMPSLPPVGLKRLNSDQQKDESKALPGINLRVEDRVDFLLKNKNR